MTADHRVHQLSKIAGRAGAHYAIANWLTGREGKQPLLHKGQESCPECGSGSYVISCGSEWRCLACFRVVPAPAPLLNQHSSGFSAQRRRGPADRGRH
jgi:ribosomal protein L37AE/L43A